MREAREEFLAAARVATAEFVEAAGRVQERAGVAIAQQVDTAARNLKAAFVDYAPTERCPRDAAPRLQGLSKGRRSLSLRQGASDPRRRGASHEADRFSEWD